MEGSLFYNIIGFNVAMRCIYYRVVDLKRVSHLGCDCARLRHHLKQILVRNIKECTIWLQMQRIAAAFKQMQYCDCLR